MEVAKPALGCRLSPPVPAGTIIKDIKQKKWKVGKPIGSGAFGDIYLARFGERDEEEYVIKVEPHSNGPLFVEIHAFLRLGLEHHRANWIPRNKKPQGWVGIPSYYGSGSFFVGKERLRFLVLSRLGTDIQKFFQSGDKPIPLTTALNISVQILESLEYIHSKGYTHNDIKAQNILLGRDHDKDTVYLVDFGLACKYKDSLGFHRDSEPDERKAHEGTLEYTSRDVHNGTHSRRGDLESLGYNLVHWVTGYLPWRESTDPEFVQSKKIGYMFNISGFLNKCFKPNKPPKVIENYFIYVNSLEFEESPDYSKLRKLLVQAMRSEHVEPYAPLVFSNKKKAVREESSDEEEESVPEGTRNTRSQDEEERYAPWSWEQVLAQDPESIIRQASRSSEQEDNEMESERAAAFQQEQVSILSNPTPEMHRLMIAKELLEKMREKMSWKEQLQEFNMRNAAQKEKFATMDLTPRETTPAMEEVIQMRAHRLATGISSPMTPEPSDDEETETSCGGGSAPGTVVKAPKRRSTRSSRSVTPTELSHINSAANTSSTDLTYQFGAAMCTRSRSTTPTESPCNVSTSSRMVTRSSGRTTPTSKSSSRASTPSIVNESCSTTRSGASTPDMFSSRSSRSRSRSASSEYDVTDGAGRNRVTRSQADKSGEASDFKLPTTVIKVTCSLCGKRMLKDSLNRHMERKHAATSDETSQEPTTRSGRVRKLSWSIHPEISEEEPCDVDLDQPPTMSCPMCFVTIPKLKFYSHFDELHSPARKITRKQFQDDSIRKDDILIVHTSTDSPAKIFNITSPSKQQQNNNDSASHDDTSNSLDFRKELKFQ